MLCYCETLPFLQGRISRVLLANGQLLHNSSEASRVALETQLKCYHCCLQPRWRYLAKKRFAKSRRLCYNMKVMNQKNACRMESLQWLLLDVRRVTERCKKVLRCVTFCNWAENQDHASFSDVKNCFFTRPHLRSIIGKQTTAAQ